MTEERNTWNRLEILSVSISGIFREAAASEFALVTTVAELPAVVLELVDVAGNREVAGISLSGDVDGVRVSAANLAAQYGVPVLDYTTQPAQRSQQ